MSSKLLLSLFINGFPSTLFSIQNNIFFLEHKFFNVLFMYKTLIQTFQTDWVYSSTQYSLVIQNSCSTYYPVFCHLLLPLIPPFDAASLSLFTLFSPPTRPGVEQPSTWTAPPLVGLHCLSALPSLAGRPQVFPRVILWLPYFDRLLPPFPSLACA